MDAAHENDPPRSMPLLRSRGRIDYSVNILAAVSLVLSLGAIVWQVADYFRGAELRLILPDQIVIARSDEAGYPNRGGGPAYVHIFGRMSYVNEGAVGYNATIRRERINIHVGTETVEHWWYQTVSADAKGVDGGTLLISKRVDARPFPVPARNSVSHLVLFQPWPNACPINSSSCTAQSSFLDWKRFLELLENGRKMKVTFFADVFEKSKPLTLTCRVEMSVESYTRLKERGWGSPVCR
jgi:hypothetical protein